MTTEYERWVQIDYKDRLGDRMTIVTYIRNQKDVGILMDDLGGEYITHREWVTPVLSEQGTK